MGHMNLGPSHLRDHLHGCDRHHQQYFGAGCVPGILRRRDYRRYRRVSLFGLRGDYFAFATLSLLLLFQILAFNLVRSRKARMESAAAAQCCDSAYYCALAALQLPSF